MPGTRKSGVTGRRSRPVLVAEEIKDWVVREGLAVGDRLPGEAELIRRFGMAKGTIREAMRILEAQGLVESRTGPGGGIFVHEVSEDRARALLGNYFYFKELTVAHIYALRKLLEPEMAASLAGKLSDEVLSALEADIAVYDQPAATLEEERDQHVAALAFHARLAREADNPLLGFLIGFMARILSDITVHRELYAPPNEELWRKGRDFHRRLVRALRSGDGAEARRIMRAHMETAEHLMEAQESQVLRRFIAE